MLTTGIATVKWAQFYTLGPRKYAPKALSRCGIKRRPGRHRNTVFQMIGKLAGDNDRGVAVYKKN
jgi:hypothetical protein